MQQDAFDALVAAAQSGRLSDARMDQALARVLAMKRAVAVDLAALDPSIVQRRTHRVLSREAARAGIVLVEDGGNLPIGADGAWIEFASWLDSEAMERGEESNLAKVCHERGITAPISLRQADLQSDADPTPLNAARAAAKRASTLVLFTRNAHINAAQMAAARELIDVTRGQGGHAVLVALRNPYDASVFNDADTILCACGDSAPSVEAAVDALSGAFRPDGRLPVAVA